MILQLLFLALTASAGSVPEKGSESYPVNIEGPPQVLGSYTDGCIYGSQPFESGANYELMNPKRNHQYGHPQLLEVVQKLAENSLRQGWGKLAVGDASSPMGGRLAKGHTSHQVGLDVDIFYRFIPVDQTLTFEERNSWDDGAQQKYEIVKYSRPSNGNAVTAEPTAAFNEKYLMMVQAAAEMDNVERIFVSPPIKKEICKFAPSFPKWVKKIRPWDGHRSHFHIRLKCPEGSDLCKKQGGVGVFDDDPTGVGCGGADFERWFKARKKTQPKPKPVAPVPAPLPPWRRPVVTDPAQPAVTEPETPNPAEPEEEGPAEEAVKPPEAEAPKPRPSMPEWMRKCSLRQYLPTVKLSPDVKCLIEGEAPPLKLRCRDYAQAMTFTKTSSCVLKDLQAKPADCAGN